MGGFLILTGLVAVAVVALVGSYYLKKKRREAFALVARQLGMEYWPQDPFGLLAELAIPDTAAAFVGAPILIVLARRRRASTL